MSLLFPVLTIFLIIFLSLMLRIHLSPGPRLLLTTSIITVSVLPRIPSELYLLVVLHIVFLMLWCCISCAPVFWPPCNRPLLNVCHIPGRGSPVFRIGMSARFWNRVWLDCGSPSSGVVYQIKQMLRIDRYKYEVRCLRRRQLYITRHKIGSALSEARHRDFWKEVCSPKRNTCGAQCNQPTIDGLSSNDDTASASHLNFNSY